MVRVAATGAALATGRGGGTARVGGSGSGATAAATVCCVSGGALVRVTGRLTGGVGRCSRDGNAALFALAGNGTRPAGNSRTVESRLGARGGGGPACERAAVGANASASIATAVTASDRGAVFVMV
jgi:hypothetical protein